MRARAPQAWFLVPGIGAQGGDLEAAIAAGLRADGLGWSSMSRAGSVTPTIRGLRRGSSAIRSTRLARPSSRATCKPLARQALRRPTHTALILDLARIGAVRFGEFTLKSGKTSPIYIDLRLLASHPDVLGRVAGAYAELLRRTSTTTRIAAIPYAALPIGTAVALQMGQPLIYPRKETKGYGTRRAIEGEFHAGERAVVLDDLITTGGIKIEAIAPLQEAGLEVQDVVVLIDRESGGQRDAGAGTATACTPCSPCARSSTYWPNTTRSPPNSRASPGLAERSGRRRDSTAPRLHCRLRRRAKGAVGRSTRARVDVKSSTRRGPGRPIATAPRAALARGGGSANPVP